MSGTPLIHSQTLGPQNWGINVCPLEVALAAEVGMGQDLVADKDGGLQEVVNISQKCLISTEDAP